jgi:hypothetical protein
METKTFRNNWLTAAGLLLSLPTAYFISISILKYGLHVNGPFDAIAPTLEDWGIKKFGWNINLLILFGPLPGVLLTIFQVMKISLRADKKEFHLHCIVRKDWFPLLVAAFSISLMGVLFLYFLGENYLGK